MFYIELMRAFVIFAGACAVAGCVSTILAAPAEKTDTPGTADSYSRPAAANYLDTRQVWWQSWAKSKRDHETVCVSCHTVLPYALSRPLLRPSLSEHEPAAPELVMLSNIEKRVKMWDEVLPYYSDEKSGPGKAVESRATEAVVNTLILASYDSQRGHLTEPTRAAFNAVWALQLQAGPDTGAWLWQNFHLAPWESDESQYQGAAFMALATGMAPDRYKDDPKIQGNLQLLRTYLKSNYEGQPLVNRLVVLWASAKFPGLLTGNERDAVITEAAKQQHADGGWSITELGTWDRRDHTTPDSKSDGYATGVTVLALEEVGAKGEKPQIKKGLAWLVANQDKVEGSWHTASVNKQRDPTTDVGKFMSDAATGYAVLALENSK